MHYHLELILPPSAAGNVKQAASEVLAPFDENADKSSHAFWDFWNVGGRYANRHVEDRLDPDQMRRFEEELSRRDVTVSGVIFGKQELKPISQAEMVDKLWREFFPDSGLQHCPLFKHSDEAGNHNEDICRIDALGHLTKAHHVIIAEAPNDWCSRYHAHEMIQASMWNGASWVETSFDGLVLPYIDKMNSKISERCDPDLRKAITVTGDWLAVTIDYHN